MASPFVIYGYVRAAPAPRKICDPRATPVRRHSDG